MKGSDGCVYPEDRYYFVEYDLWLQPIKPPILRVGVVQPFLFFVGKPKKITIKTNGSRVRRNTALAVLATRKTEAALLAPTDLEVSSSNEEVLRNPELLAEDVYGRGWLAEVRIEAALAGLSSASEAGRFYASKNVERGVVCLGKVADYEITVFGETCEGILTQISDFMKLHLSTGQSLHVVTTDPATEADLIIWAEKTGQELVDLRRSGKTIHAIFKRLV